MSREPFSPDNETLKQAQEEGRQRKMDRLRRYKRLFQSADGKFVLADLRKLFGYDLASMTYGAQLGDVGLREGMKQPLRHILLQLSTEMKPEPKPNKAQSGHTEQ